MSAVCPAVEVVEGNVTETYFPALHDWRLAEQVPVRVDETHFGPLAVWYCTRCRKIERVEIPEEAA